MGKVCSYRNFRPQEQQKMGAGKHPASPPLACRFGP